MKPLLLFPLALLLAFPLKQSAQISLGAGDIPAIGDAITYGADTLSPSISVGTAGGGQSWDFTNVQEDIQIVNNFITPIGAPNAGDFPTSNLVVEINDIYNYAQITVNEVIALGTVFDVFGSGTLTSVVFDQPQTVYTIPTAYGDDYTDVYGFDVRADGSDFGVDSVRYKQTNSAEVSVDAWGSVTVPAGTYNALRRQIVTSSTDSIWIKFLGFWTLFDNAESTTTTYEWLSAESKGTLAEADLDQLGNVESFTYFISLIPAGSGPVALFGWDELSPGSFQFNDQSTNDPTSWLWDFGDGNTNTMQDPMHTYAAPGEYTVCLTVDNGLGTDMACQVLTVIFAPVASFTYDQISSGNFQFTDQSIYDPTSWEWDFGDGNTSTMQDPAHTYAEPGEYDVCLTAGNSAGSSQICETITVVLPPEAAFSFVDQGDGVVVFTDQSIYDPTSWSWDFGDGNTSTMQDPTHTYAASGDYTVCLTVANSEGSDEACQDLMIVVTSVDEPLAAGALRVAPNPAADWVRFEWQSPSADPVEVTVSDLLGRVLHRSFLSPEQTIATGSWAAGLYTYALRDAQGRLLESGRLVVE
ncbi:MAG: PKD domain-containing protein [Saprospiraceae bacterium]|nr:PKD domain-containing protein [Saprospiraceae bacterium]